jgi:hypothetical protein
MAPLTLPAPAGAVVFDDGAAVFEVVAVAVAFAFVEVEFVGDMADAVLTAAAKSCGKLIVEFPMSMVPSSLSTFGLAAKKERVYLCE